MPTTAEQRNLNYQLIRAAENGNMRLTSELLAQGADPNTSEQWGYTPLRHAAWYNYAQLAGLLIDACADVNKPGPFETPLITASIRGSTDVIERLLGAGADPNCTDHDGNTALMMAVRQDDCELAAVCLLLAAGARTDIVNAEKQTALHLAMTLAANDPDMEHKIARVLAVDPTSVGEHEGIIKLLTTPLPATWTRRKYKLRRPNAKKHSKLRNQTTLFESYRINGHYNYMPLATDLNRWTRETIMTIMLIIKKLQGSSRQQTTLPAIPIEMWLDILSRVHSVQIESYQPHSRRWVLEKEQYTPARQVAIAYHGR